MDAVAAGLLLAILILETVSHLSLKAASARAARLGGLPFIRALLGHAGFWTGIVSFLALFLAWLAFIARVPLAQGVMAGSITIVGVMLGGRLWFGERLTPARSLAVGLITLGVLGMLSVPT